MKALQTKLQALLTGLDPWLDAAFPIATALICVKARLAAYSLLTAYLLLRLLQRSDRQSWRWILISLLVINAGTIIHDRDLKPGSASDYLIIAMSFAAGFERSRQQWQRSLAWITSCLLPLLGFSLLAGDNLIQETSSFTGFNINKLGFLAGLLTTVSYGWMRDSQQRTSTWLARGGLALGIISCSLTQSRAAIAVPVIAIAVEIALSHAWTRRQLIAGVLLALALGAGATYTWYLKPQANYNLATDYRLGELNRVETIRCWFSSTSSSETSLLLGMGFGRPAQNFCGPDAIPSLKAMDKGKGLQHAHNLYAQVFAETGAGGLILLVGLTLAALRKAWCVHSQDGQRSNLPVVIYLFLMALGLTFWQVMMINQVLVGYCLAALTATDPDRDAAGEATPATQQP